MQSPLQNLMKKESEDPKFKPNCQIDQQTFEVQCEPELQRDNYTEKAQEPMRFKILPNKQGQEKVQILSTGTSSDALFKKTFDFVLNNSLSSK